MDALRRLALVLLIIGGLNWGLVGIFQYDLVAGIFGGQDSFLSRVIYTLVGLSALYCLTLLFETNEDARTIENRSFNYNTEFGDDPDITRMDDERKSKRD